MLFSNIRYFSIIICMFVIFNLSNAQDMVELNYKIIISFPTPGSSPQGLAWDGENLWIADDSTNLIYKIKPSTGKTLLAFVAPSSEPRGLAWDGNYLLLSENQNNKIYKLKSSGIELGKVISSINAPISTHKKTLNEQIGGLTWDGKYLWSAYFAGWSSKIVKVDPNNGNIDTSFFCDAEDLSFDGIYLWNVDTQNGQYKGLVKKREILSGKCIAYFRTPGYYPSGLAFDGTYFWLADRVEKLIYKIIIIQ